jgi:hypothetical protein
VNVVASVEKLLARLDDILGVDVILNTVASALKARE